MENLIDAFSSFEEELDFTGQVSAEWINKGEELLGIKFPKSYRFFLENWGEVNFDGKEYYGVFREDFENSGIPDVVWVNLNERKSDFPNNLIVFKQNNGVEYYCFDVSKTDEDGECPIVIWDNINKEIEQTLDMTFAEFLLEDLEESFG